MRGHSRGADGVSFSLAGKWGLLSHRAQLEPTFQTGAQGTCCGCAPVSPRAGPCQPLGNHWEELALLTRLSLTHTVQFSIIIKPLFESFRGVVSTSSLEELHRTTLSWLDQHCSLPILRPSESGPCRGLSVGGAEGNGCGNHPARDSSEESTGSQGPRMCDVPSARPCLG